MSIIKRTPQFKSKHVLKIFNYLLEREIVLKLEKDLDSLKEIKRLLVYIATNFSYLDNDNLSSN